MNARSSKFILRLVVSKLARNFNSMSSALRGNHVEITANNTREDILSEATISDIYRLSPTVKGFDLIVKDPEFSFKAGQWYAFSFSTEIVSRLIVLNLGSTYSSPVRIKSEDFRCVRLLPSSKKVRKFNSPLNARRGLLLNGSTPTARSETSSQFVQGVISSTTHQQQRKCRT